MSASKSASVKSSRKESAKGGSREDVVIRISKENHARLRALVQPSKSSLKTDGKPRLESTNECLSRLLDSTTALLEGQMLYLVGDQAFESADVARGEAIMNAARFQEPVQWPKVAVVIGEDTV